MINRHLTTLIHQSLNSFPVVLLIGARQVGKSTLAKQLVAENLFDEYITLDDITVLSAARSDPDGFLNQFANKKIVFDEVQRVPDLLRALKKIIDQNKQPGKFLLTGSANILSYPNVAESLAGRMDIIHLEGLSWRESEQKLNPACFLQDLFSQQPLTELLTNWQTHIGTTHFESQQKLCQRLFYGSFPEIILKQDLNYTERWFSAYQTAYIERDVRDLSRLLDIVAYAKLLRLAGMRTANLLNLHNLGLETGIDQRTAARYLEMLTLTFQMNLLHPWFNNHSKRLIKTPKIYLNDTGMACFLFGIASPNNLLNSTQIGAIFETAVWAELRKLLVFLPRIQTTFYRTHAGREVDFVLTQGEIIWGIECKWSSSVNNKDFAGLIDLQQATNGKAKGIILYLGEKIVSFSDTLIAIPINILL